MDRRRGPGGPAERHGCDVRDDARAPTGATCCARRRRRSGRSPVPDGFGAHGAPPRTADRGRPDRHGLITRPAHRPTRSRRRPDPGSGPEHTVHAAAPAPHGPPETGVSSGSDTRRTTAAENVIRRGSRCRTGARGRSIHSGHTRRPSITPSRNTRTSHDMADPDRLHPPRPTGRTTGRSENRSRRIHGSSENARITSACAADRKGSTNQSNSAIVRVCPIAHDDAGPHADRPVRRSTE